MHKQEHDEIDWTCIPYAIETLLDDGHRPEVLQEEKTQVLRIYPKYHSDRSAHVHVVDDAVPESLVDALYEYTIKYCKDKAAWGSYVTINEVQGAIGNNNELSTVFDKCNQQELSKYAAAYFFRNSMMMIDDNSIRKETIHIMKSNAQQKSDVESDQVNSKVPCLWNDDDMLNMDVHGVALWALASNVGSSVPYHIDYAELLRYEHGYMIPPILAGTLQCSKHEIRGGEYCVTTDGLHHYNKCGYKGILLNPFQTTSSCSDDEKIGISDTTITSNSPVLPVVQVNTDHQLLYGTPNKFTVEEEYLMHNDPSWIRIPYKYNRMICQSGHLPHLSTRVESINNSTNTSTNTSNGTSSSKNDRLRVIVGFNVFLKDVGPIIQQAPEHSDSFRRRVSELRRRNQKLQTTSFTASSSRTCKKLSLDDFKANPRLASFLVEAKRERMKHDFKIVQEKLDQDINDYIYSLATTGIEFDSSKDGIQFIEKKVMNKFGRLDGVWPNDVDVQVHFEHRFNRHRIQQIFTGTKGS